MKIAVEKTSKKKIDIFTECNRHFQIDAHEVIHDRSSYYAERDKDTTYEEEYEFLDGDHSEITDWLFNNMDWYECKTLKEIPSKPKSLRNVEICEYEVN